MPPELFHFLCTYQTSIDFGHLLTEQHRVVHNCKMIKISNKNKV